MVKLLTKKKKNLERVKKKSNLGKKAFVANVLLKIKNDNC